MILIPEDPEVPAGTVYLFYDTSSTEHEQFNRVFRFPGGSKQDAIKYVVDSISEAQGRCMIVHRAFRSIRVLSEIQTGGRAYSDSLIYDSDNPEIVAKEDFRERCDRIMQLRSMQAYIGGRITEAKYSSKRTAERRLLIKAGILERLCVDGAVTWLPKMRKRFKGCVVGGIEVWPLIGKPATVWDCISDTHRSVAQVVDVILLIDGRKWRVPYYEVGFLS